jgi:microsomal dipeptidase-like Zn-dependent dipeptidase
VIADLHAHYAMSLLPEADGRPYDLLVTAHGRARLRDGIRARLVHFAGRFANYRDVFSGPRVTVPSMQQGGVGVACSVLYSFFDELTVEKPYASAPESGYLATLVRQLELVERDIAAKHGTSAAVAHDPAELDAALATGRTAFVHCVEGGFHLGPTPADVDRAITELARRGVAYVTLAHLVWRRVATNAPAVPFLPDHVYRLLFRQPSEGLSDLGEAAVRAMVRERVLIDLSHMSDRSVADTFALLDELDPDRRVPVIASHAGFRFGGQEYAIQEPTLRRIAERGGVVGLIFAQHQLLDGLRHRKTKTFEQSFEVIRRHIDRIAEITGSHRHVGLGSDFDGFIKPTLGGLESMADMAKLEAALRDRYGDADAELITSGNALRLLRGYWRGA